MRYKISNLLWGMFWIVLGIGIAGNVLDIWDFSLFFDGWWTMFIIIPCSISIVRNGFGNGSTIGLMIGILLLLATRDVIEYSMLRRLFVPIILILIGFNMILKNIFNESRHVKINVSYQGIGSYASTFSSQRINIPNEPFYGTELNSVFGSLELDLRNAIIDQDIVINATSVFGGIDIYVPDNIKVKVSSTSIFGGVTNRKRKGETNSPIVYINATCMFGGVEIK